jgi:transposase InsO family protein
VHAEWDGTYGRPRITAELRDDGERVNHERVGRVMRKYGIAGLRLRRRQVTTMPEPSAIPVPDLLGRDFTANAPNTKYVGDITYLPVGDGEFLYLATVIDCFSRRLVGWSIADYMRTSLVADALQAAAATRGSLAGAVFHSDHGAQYASRHFADLCGRLGVVRSMGAVGTSADNALAESLNATLKRETLQGARRFENADACRLSVPLGHPLQHQTAPLPPRTERTQHLRTAAGYRDIRRITNEQVSTPRGQDPLSLTATGAPAAAPLPYGPAGQRYAPL